jgi:hypothetical protein
MFMLFIPFIRSTGPMYNNRPLNGDRSLNGTYLK